ncbi:MAG TPA: DUF6498-containing protein [Vitreimonas sp.]|uniref:DUF6498-containing protein n=1 Tax=Vitreimonas sp. TaxID=3069702 RepID=UPI002D4F4EE8|nr:DUF6498-containing protein [Vitreimonas sp.]HYD89047.1 DUF6498-containing protein [Vitreimonas sp.]
MGEAAVPNRHGRAALIAAIGFNLVPVVGVLFWGWSAFALIFLYWLENVVIGGRTLLSMAISGIVGGANFVGVLFFCAFFTLHYGLFCFAHGSFVVGMFAGEALGSNMLDLPGAARALFALQPGLSWGLASIVLWQALQLTLFVVRGEAAGTNPLALMAAPYPRIVILHLAIIFGGFLLMLMDEPLAGLVVLALVKTGFDVAEATGRAPSFNLARGALRQS